MAKEITPEPMINTIQEIIINILGLTSYDKRHVSSSHPWDQMYQVIRF
jgi:hypothetical protein